MHSHDPSVAADLNPYQPSQVDPVARPKGTSIWRDYFFWLVLMLPVGFFSGCAVYAFIDSEREYYPFHGFAVIAIAFAVTLPTTLCLRRSTSVARYFAMGIANLLACWAVGVAELFFSSPYRGEPIALLLALPFASIAPSLLGFVILNLNQRKAASSR